MPIPVTPIKQPFITKNLTDHQIDQHSVLVATNPLSIMANSNHQQRVEFAELPKLPPPLAAHPIFQFLHEKVATIDAEILGATSRSRKLKVITQTAAVHLTCLKLAKAIAVEEEDRDQHHKKAWAKALIQIVDRARDVMAFFHISEL